ncbi:ribonuclease activity regulator RraA [Streptomyces sp. enrichment culture]|uniref:RraA family protein n=1 Tax=Streptomyces sp. enrichment culture TaxID=1795815 RepID=UPI003F576550
MIDRSTVQALESVSTATLSAQLRSRGIENAFLEHLTVGQPGKRMVGEARTLRYTALREDVFAVRGGGMNEQKRVVDTIRPGEVLVIEARGDLGAGTIGDILALRLMRRGGVGVVTDGGARDTPALRELGLPLYFGAPHAAVLGRRHVPMDSDLPITCGGVLVMPGDVLCGDAEGVVVLPAAIAADVARAAVVQEREERYITEQVAKGESLDGLYPMGEAHRKQFELWSEDGADEVS